MAKGDKKQLREYQKRGARQICAAWRKVDRVLYVSPTSSGKTVTAVSVVKPMGRVMWVAHTRELLDQAVATLREAGVSDADIGLFYGAKTGQNEDAKFIVASIQTLAHRDLTGFDVIVIDEAHRAAAPMYQRMLESHGGKVLGLTATPTRLDGKPLDFFEEMVMGPSPKELIASGHVVKPRIFAPSQSLVSLKEIRAARGDYDSKSASKLMRSRAILGQVFDHWKEMSGGRNTVIFCCDVKHANAVADEFNSNGVEAQVIHGAMPVADRELFLARLDDPKDTLRVIVNVDVLVEGWDQPSVKCVVLCRPTMSTTRFMQMTGRIGRKYKNQSAIILDHADNTRLHGMPYADRPWSLTQGWQKVKGDGKGRAGIKNGELVELEGDMAEFSEALIPELPPEIVERRAKGLPDLCVGCGAELNMSADSIAYRRKQDSWLCSSCAQRKWRGRDPIDIVELEARAIAACERPGCNNELGMSKSRVNARVLSGRPFYCLSCKADENRKHTRIAPDRMDMCDDCGAAMSMDPGNVRRREARGVCRCQACECRARGKSMAGKRVRIDPRETALRVWALKQREPFRVGNASDVVRADRHTIRRWLIRLESDGAVEPIGNGNYRALTLGAAE